MAMFISMGLSFLRFSFLGPTAFNKAWLSSCVLLIFKILCSITWTTSETRNLNEISIVVRKWSNSKRSTLCIDRGAVSSAKQIRSAMWGFSKFDDTHGTVASMRFKFQNFSYCIPRPLHHNGVSRKPLLSMEASIWKTPWAVVFKSLRFLSSSSRL